MNRAPAGSAMTVPRTGGMSNGSTRTVPPCSRAVEATLIGVCDRERDVPVRRLTIGERHDPGDAFGEAGRRAEVRVALADARIELLEEVRVARQANHRAVQGAHVDLVDLPAEDLAVEPSGTSDVGGLELAEIPRAGCVHRIGSGDVAWLPEAEAGARRIGAPRRPAEIEQVEGLDQDRSTRIAHPGGGRVGVIDGDVRVPGWRRRDARWWRGHRRDLPAIQ